MRTLIQLPLTLLFSTALIACGEPDRGNNGGGMKGQSRTGTADDATVHNNGASADGGLSGNQQTAHATEDMDAREESTAGTVSMSCLRNMKDEDWHQLGLNGEQMLRVQRLQQDMGIHAGAGSGTVQTIPGTGSVGGTVDPGSQGTATRQGNAEDVDADTQGKLKEILTHAQLQQLGRRCASDDQR